MSIRGEKTSIRSDNEKTRSRLYAVVNGLAFHFITKALEANLARLAFHQSIIMQRLLVGDVVAVAKFFLHIATCTDIRRIFAELKDVRT